ncbi:uncharacterized protein LOC133179266 [Saccostrea echinata]|uniref:uncharacterized protein LOC133179266 n=1 Tax=Saccostrea echinata TaxID=191078 RepID=UPI002A81709E|nr:uncharacterized protein LOC133179266 [Saccostrea echinata]
MRSCQQFYRALFILSLMKGSSGSSEHHVDWTTASKDCNVKYESQLIPQSYIEDHNLYSDVIKGIGVNVSAWIDGKIQEIGCDQVKCLRIKRLNEHGDRKLPFICVTSADIEVNLTEVSYKESTELCGSAKFRIEGPLRKYALLSIINKFLLSPKPFTTFWFPNAELSDNEDTFCTFVVSRDDETVETKFDNCSTPRMGVCINTTYITDYQTSMMLETTAKQLQPVKGGGVIWTIKDDAMHETGDRIITQDKEKLQAIRTLADKDAGILEVSVSLALSASSLFLVVLFMCISTLLWKRLSSKLDIILKGSQFSGPEIETVSGPRKKKIKKKVYMYEVLPQIMHGHSTRVKAVPKEQENPYSEITSRRESGYHSNPGTSGQTEETI